jgi:hypothetical protein
LNGGAPRRAVALQASGRLRKGLDLAIFMPRDNHLLKSAQYKH